MVLRFEAVSQLLGSNISPPTFTPLLGGVRPDVSTDYQLNLPMMLSQHTFPEISGFVLLSPAEHKLRLIILSCVLLSVLLKIWGGKGCY